MSASQRYELTYILDERAGQAEASAKADHVTKFVTSHGGSIESTTHWGRRELAYPIKKNRSGFYSTLVFTLDQQAVKEFNQELNYDEQIIRHLVTKAYTTAVAGSLHPEEPEKEKKDAATGEEAIRRTPRRTKKTEEVAPEAAVEEDNLSETERMEKLDEILKEEE